MTTSDPIADMLTRIRNGLAANHPKVDVPASRLKTDIAKILKDEGYIANYKLTEEGSRKSIRIYLKYSGLSACRVRAAACTSVRRPCLACWVAWV